MQLRKTGPYLHKILALFVTLASPLKCVVVAALAVPQVGHTRQATVGGRETESQSRLILHGGRQICHHLIVRTVNVPTTRYEHGLLGQTRIPILKTNVGGMQSFRKG